MSDIQPVVDTDLLARLERGLAPLLDPPWHLWPEALRQRGWVVVPSEKGRHIEDDAATRLSRAIREATEAPCYAVATEPIDPPPFVLSVPTSEDGLLALSHECAGLNVVLVPADFSFLVLFTSEDYNLVAGPRVFVESALGARIEEALDAFLSYADDPWWDGRLLAVFRRYST